MLKSIKKRFKNFLSIGLVVLIALIPGCKKEPKKADPAIVNLLVGPPTSVWALTHTEFSGKTMTLPSCETSYNYISFFADGSYIQSIHRCEIPLGTLIIVPPTGNGQWTLDADNKSLHVTSGVFGTYTINMLNATTLVLNNGGYVNTYTSIPAQPFLSLTQYLTGTGSKTWKCLKKLVSAAQQPLTADLAALRLTFTSNGNLVKSYTNASYGQAVNNSWILESSANQSFGFASPLAGFTTPNTAYPFYIIELCTTSFTFTYYDTAIAAQVIVYMVPE